MWEWTCKIYERRSDPTIRESIIVKKSLELRALKCGAAEDVELHLANDVSSTHRTDKLQLTKSHD
ncbi:hypothetical protein CCR75_008024 [Bremia lactucae]|uniref:Uncharacterized protein n=1 Tax=Bremia lactucae TaxID=4779 RepID=A0A976FQE3_BRELC|nr:hypothetical protein CCR75_008024 [Bremia lactucae]